MSVSLAVDPTSVHFDALAPGALGGASITIASAPAATILTARIETAGSPFSVFSVTTSEWRWEVVDPGELPPGHKGPLPRHRVLEQVGESDGVIPLAVQAGQVIEIMVNVLTPNPTSDAPITGALLIQGDDWDTARVPLALTIAHVTSTLDRTALIVPRGGQTEQTVSVRSITGADTVVSYTLHDGPESADLRLDAASVWVASGQQGQITLRLHAAPEAALGDRILSLACGPAAPPATSTAVPAAAATVVAAAPAAGAVVAAAAQSIAGSRTLVISNAYSFTTKDTDPDRGGVDFDADPFFHAVYDTLLTFKPGDSTSPQPLVAESYSASADARTYTFKLRKDVKFSDGTPLKATDVAFSYNRLLNLHDTPVYLLDGVMSVEAPDDYTFTITSKDANPAIPFIVTNPALGVINSTVIKAHGGSDQPGADKTDTAEDYFQTASAGSGPYIMSAVSSTQMELKANPNYWGPNKPGYQNVVYRSVAAATQFIEIQKATDEVVLSLSGDQSQSLQGNDKLQVNSFTSPNLTFLYVNENPDVLSFGANPHFLQAVRYGLDYDALVKVAGSGSAQAPGVVPPQFLGALPATSAVHRDVAKAKSELQAAGIANPSVELDYSTSTTGITEAEAAKIQASLGEVGITITLNGQPSAISTPNYRGGKNPMGLYGWAPDYPDPNDYLPFLPGQLVGKRAGWLPEANPTLVDMGNKAGSTADNTSRAQQFRDIQNKLNQESPIFPLLNAGQSVVTTKNLTNVAYSAVWYIDFAAIGTN